MKLILCTILAALALTACGENEKVSFDTLETQRAIARGFHAQLKERATISFVETPAKASEELTVGFEIVKQVITTRLAENAAAATARENKERKQRLMVLIEGKENEQLGAKSLDELRAIAASL